MTQTVDHPFDVRVSDPTIEAQDYLRLNAELNLWKYDDKGQKYVDYDADRKAVRAYFLNHVNANTQYFHSLEEKIEFLVENGYYQKEPLDAYKPEFIKKLFKHIYSYKFRFPNFASAYYFYSKYALKTFDGRRYLERYEDRIAAVSLYLARGDEKLAWHIATEHIEGRLQTATPTFLNSLRAAGGELVSCFLLSIEDDLNSIYRGINSAAQLSKRGGGVGINLSNLRATGDPIKGMMGVASGIVPPMKVLEDTFSYVNQLGQRNGAGAAYLSVHHLDIENFLDTKKENADEKTRIKTLSIGVMMTDIVFEKARKGEPFYAFSPYDVSKKYGKEFSEISITEEYENIVNDPRIRKKAINARDFLNRIAEIQMESGYPYIIFEDAANRANNVGGRIKMSNLCSEILQPHYPSVVRDDQTYEVLGEDVSCNLASLNMLNTIKAKDFGLTIETSIRTLFAVSDMSNIAAVPTVMNGNKNNHAVGLGVMNAHGTFAHYGMYYGDEESLDLTNMYFYLVTYHAFRTNMLLAKEAGETFLHFPKSKYATGEYFERFTNPKNPNWFKPQTAKVKEILKDVHIPTTEDWEKLVKNIKKYGLRLSHLQALAPTGSISYLQSSTASLTPVPIPGGLVEQRSEGQIGQIYVPAGQAEGNEEYFTGTDMYSIDNRKVIDLYSVAQYYVDQAMSLTLGYNSNETTKSIVQNLLYAYSKNKPSTKELDERGKMLAKYPSAEIKSLYYVRMLNMSIDALNNIECVSCSI